MTQPLSRNARSRDGERRRRGRTAPGRAFRSYEPLNETYFSFGWFSGSTGMSSEFFIA